MEKLERLIMPIVIAVGIIGLLLARAEADTVIVVAKIVGIFLAIMLASGFIVRWVLKFRRGKRELADLQQEYEDLLAAQAAAEAETTEEGKEPEHA